jgi:hypothetical protein
MNHLTLEKLIENFKRASNLTMTNSSKQTGISKRTVLSYIPLPSPYRPQQQQHDLSKYIERVQLINNDIEWLLKLKSEHFADQIETNPAVSKLLKTYLSAFSTVYLFKHEYQFDADGDEHIHHVNSILKRFMFYLILRICTVANNRFAKIFTIQDLFDLCVLYDENRSLDNLLETYINKSPSLNDEFKAYAAELLRTFEVNEAQLDKLSSRFDRNRSFFRKQTGNEDRVTQTTDHKQLVWSVRLVCLLARRY